MNENICLNLWYFIGDDQNIKWITGKAYNLPGMTDDEAKPHLEALSLRDFSTVPRWECPEANEIHYSLIKTIGIGVLYKAVIDEIEVSIAPICISDEFLFYITALYDFGEGTVAVKIEDGFIPVITEKKRNSPLSSHGILVEDS